MLTIIIVLIIILINANIQYHIEPLPINMPKCYWTISDDNNCVHKYRNTCHKLGGYFHHKLGSPWCYKISIFSF